MNTPLYNVLRALAKTDPLRMHMPGHKGRPVPGLPEEWAMLDFTEITPTGNLFSGGDAIEAAEVLWAEKFGAEQALFLTGGSTLGLHAAIHLCCRPGDVILADRGSHRALWNGLALVDAEPVYLSRPWCFETQMTGPVSPEEVERLLTEHPGAAAVAVTSPNYYGVDCDCQAIAHICHAHGVRLIVDSAHGAHYPWVGKESPARWADVTVVSAHKTLPAPGQSSLLFANGFSPRQVRDAAAVYSTSSPSYAMMGALDRLRAFLDTDDGYRQLLSRHLPRFRDTLQTGTAPVRVILTDDPARLVLDTSPSGCTGFQMSDELEEEGVYCEMADHSHLVCILTGMDGEPQLSRLRLALDRVGERLTSFDGELLPAFFPPPPLPERVCSLRRALFGETEFRPLWQCAGRISAQQIAPYPPGIPVIAPGERITKKYLAYLEEIGYNKDHPINILR